jgi:transposase-like protein
MAFKQQVVQELESGRLGSLGEAQVRYGIGGSGTIRKWLKRLGKNHLIPKVVRVEKPDEANQVAALKKQVRELQQALGQTQCRNVLNEAFLEIACEKLGEDVDCFKKKVDAQRSAGRRSGPVSR